MDTRGRNFHILLYTSDDGSNILGDNINSHWKVMTATTRSDVHTQLQAGVDCFIIDGSNESGSSPPLETLFSVESVISQIPTIYYIPPVVSSVVHTAYQLGVTEVVYHINSVESGPSCDSNQLPPEQYRREGVVGLLTAIGSIESSAGASIEDVVLDVSRSLMSAAADEVDTKIKWSLESVGTAIGVDRCIVYRWGADIEMLTQTHQWSTDQLTVTDTDTARLAIEDLPHGEALQSSFNTIRLPLPPTTNKTGPRIHGSDTQLIKTKRPIRTNTHSDPLTQVSAGNELQEDDHTRETDTVERFLEARGVQSLLAIPMVVDWELVGVLTVESVSNKHWSETTVERLRTVGELIAYTEQQHRHQQRLSKQNERLERFASVISHDLQNPLNIVKGYTELAYETENTAQLEPAIRAADRMHNLLDDLLTLAQEGKAIGTVSPTSLKMVVENAWDNVDTASMTYTTNNLGTIVADETRLTEVLENLFRNAAEHAGPKTKITVSGTPDGFFVADNGPGIPQSARDTVFEHGYTSDDGTGLGLSIVQTIVQAHGWEITVTESEEGGAKFMITTEH